MITLPYEIATAIIVVAFAAGFIVAALFTQWLDNGPIEKLSAKKTVKPWPTDKHGHANRRSEDRQDGVKSIHGYQPHTSTKPVQPPGAE